MLADLIPHVVKRAWRAYIRPFQTTLSGSHGHYCAECDAIYRCTADPCVIPYLAAHPRCAPRPA